MDVSKIQEIKACRYLLPIVAFVKLTLSFDFEEGYSIATSTISSARTAGSFKQKNRLGSTKRTTQRSI
jgi:hypothetical protein